MSEKLNFLLGYGERLMGDVPFVRGPVEKHPPYTFTQAQERLLPLAESTAAEALRIPKAACPNDEAVCMVTLHPEYLARSYYPATFFRETRLEPIGSKSCRIIPERRSRHRAPEMAESTVYFVSAPRAEIQNLQLRLGSCRDGTSLGNDLPKIEKIECMSPAERLKPVPGSNEEIGLEIVLHTGGMAGSQTILEAFDSYARSLGMRPVLDKRIFVGDLCFLPLVGIREKLRSLAEFSFLRTARALPRLRVLTPGMRSHGARRPAGPLPRQGPLDPTLRVAIFDGGLQENSPLSPWADSHDAPGVGIAVPDYLEHGHDVTSALLFGSLKPSEASPIPFCKVDHYRVLDEDSVNDPLELYDVLQRVKAVLHSRHFDYFNLSVAPEYPVEDDDVHPWTAFFDQHLARGQALAAVAVGNGGQRDRAAGLARVQVPADCVNALAVGAASSEGELWERASYSSIGPGRKPGQVKPDILTLGGSDNEPFLVFDAANPNRLLPVQGTSFASPACLRLGIAIRSHLGGIISTLATKALLIHSAEDSRGLKDEHGWGRLPPILEDVITCPDDTARILYQGEFEASDYIRARIPLPEGAITGKVTIHATLCLACETDPEHPGNYTRGGLDIQFRPNENDIKKGSTHAKTKPFFSKRSSGSEEALREYKWETVLNSKATFLPTTLVNPVFDIHCNTREQGHNIKGSRPIRYALVISVCAPKTPDFYNKIVRRYQTVLEPLRSVLQVPIRNR